MLAVSHMDTVSHVFVGASIGELSGHRNRRRIALTGLFAALPDLPCFLVGYPIAGYLADRDWLIPQDADWDGLREAYPFVAVLWELPHSFLFLMCVIVPLVRFWRLPAACAVAYASHLVLDIPTHTGEWAVAPIWPIPWRIEGFTDPWMFRPGVWLASVLATASLWRLSKSWANRRSRFTR